MKEIRIVVLDQDQIGGWSLRGRLLNEALQASANGRVLAPRLLPRRILYYNIKRRRFSLDSPCLTDPRPCPHIDASLSGRDPAIFPPDAEDPFAENVLDDDPDFGLKLPPFPILQIGDDPFEPDAADDAPCTPPPAPHAFGEQGGLHPLRQAAHLPGIGYVSPKIIDQLSDHDPIPSSPLHTDYMRHWCRNVCPESRAYRYLSGLPLADGRVADVEPVGFLELTPHGLSELCGGLAEASGILVAVALQIRLLQLGEQTLVQPEKC